jgi:hypothetical protein
MEKASRVGDELWGIILLVDVPVLWDTQSFGNLLKEEGSGPVKVMDPGTRFRWHGMAI